METKAFNATFDLKALNEEEGTFEGHAAIFDQPDMMGDVFLKGAFTKSLHTHKPSRVKLLRQHRQDKMLGVFTEIKEDDKGLAVKGQLLLGLRDAQEAMILLKAGALDALSVGFQRVSDQFNSETKVSEIIEAKLFEISLVAIPAQQEARIMNVKAVSPEDITTKSELEVVLRDVGISVSTSKFIVAGWTPPARRNAEGDDSMVASLRAAATSLKQL